MSKYYQQGDIILFPTNEIKGKNLNHLIIARGETTGHTHRVMDGAAELYEDTVNNNRIKYLRIKSPKATVRHEEHKEIILPKGDYFVRIVKEYDHFLEESREVRD